MRHLSENVGKHLSHEYSIEGFMKNFTTCVYGYRSLIEFEENWVKMIQSYNLAEHKWLSSLYDIRHKWYPAFSLDSFSVGVRFTQRSESTNSVFHRLSCKTMSLTRLDSCRMLCIYVEYNYFSQWIYKHKQLKKYTNFVGYLVCKSTKQLEFTTN